MSDRQTGRIIKATGGFYYVRTSHGRAFTCRAKGLFRNQNITPLVGDLAEVLPGLDGEATVVEILPRRNATVRPPLANLDQMVLVLSVVDPAPNLLVVDRFLALLEKQDIQPLVVITKSDLADPADLAGLYGKAGFPVLIVNNETGDGVSALMDALSGKVSAFSGNSGVGKSSLLNLLDPRFAVATGDTSKKLGRGKHTTRHVELFPLPGDALVADTPGFSSMSITEMGGIGKDELAACFRDLAPYTEKCRFVNCSHTCEKGCAVLEALARGEIDPRRHQSYTQLYNEVKDIKPWEQK